MRKNIKTCVRVISISKYYNKQQIRQYYDPKYEELLRQNMSTVSSKTNFVDNKKIEEFIIKTVQNEVNKALDLHKVNIVNQIKENILSELNNKLNDALNDKKL